MTWDVIKQVLFPAGEGSVTLTFIYWSVLTALLGLEFFAPQFAKQQRAQRWPANFGLGLINMALVPLAPISGFLAAGWAKRNGIGVLNWLDCGGCSRRLPRWRSRALRAMQRTVFFTAPHGFGAFTVSTILTLPWTCPLDCATIRLNYAYVLIDSLVAIIFGLLPLALMIYGITELMFALFSHANIKLPGKMDQMLRVFFVTPRIHAIHHLSYQPETDSNYGTVLMIWDRLFGTYSDFRADCPEVIQFGLLELQDDRVDDLWWQLKSPVLILVRAVYATQFRRITGRSDIGPSPAVPCPLRVRHCAQVRACLPRKHIGLTAYKFKIRENTTQRGSSGYRAGPPQVEQPAAVKINKPASVGPREIVKPADGRLGCCPVLLGKYKGAYILRPKNF